MPKPRSILAALIALPFLYAAPSEGAKDASHGGPVATIAGRDVEEADIQRAALVLEHDPLRKRSPAAWRKKLLDLCVDRELLALEAERKGLLDDPDVKRRIERGTTRTLFEAVRERFLLPAIAPTASEIDTARAGGLYRRVKLDYMLTVGDKKNAYMVFNAIRNGARFDSVAAENSVHPSAATGGHLGWKRVGALNPGAWGAFKTVKAGDVLGPYPNFQAHEIYQVLAVEDPDDKELRETMMRDRAARLEARYHVELLKKYHFELNPTAVGAVIFAASTEPVDSILASLDVNGSRPKRGAKPALDVIARVDGDSITYRDIALPEILRREGDGKGRINDTPRLLGLCTTAMLPGLIARDAQERGVDRDPVVTRRLRLVREELSTLEMVARAVPEPDKAAARAYFNSHRARYERPAAQRALVAVFATEDTAKDAARDFARSSFRDSLFSAIRIQKQDRASATSLLRRRYAEISLFRADRDSLSRAVWTLKEGQVSPVIRTPHGYAVALATGREAARPLTFDEASSGALADARAAAENAWVLKLLGRLRAATPARTMPARLDAVRISESGGTR